MSLFRCGLELLPFASNNAQEESLLKYQAINYRRQHLSR